MRRDHTADGSADLPACLGCAQDEEASKSDMAIMRSQLRSVSSMRALCNDPNIIAMHVINHLTEQLRGAGDALGSYSEDPVELAMQRALYTCAQSAIEAARISSVRACEEGTAKAGCLPV